jgi:hypothetical protein
MGAEVTGSRARVYPLTIEPVKEERTSQMRKLFTNFAVRDLAILFTPGLPMGEGA